MNPSDIRTTAEPADAIARGKEARLMNLLRSYGSVIVAYSGGVDSTYLAWAAHEALGGAARIVTAQSPSLAASEFAFAEAVARDRGWSFRAVATGEADNPRWRANDADRCYFCKHELFTVLGDLARREGVARLLYGAIPEDHLDVRPGAQAAAEFAVAAPLVDVGLTKEEIRLLSREHALPTWGKPQAACLASRFPTGTPITDTGLRQVERAEAALSGLGFRGHRVRHHGELARIELQDADWEFVADPETRMQIVAALRAVGYRRVTLDLVGYRPAGLDQ